MSIATGFERRHGRELDLGDEPRLTQAEETALAERVAQGDQEARDQFIRSMLPLVASVAMRYRGLGLPFGDLVGEGTLGLILAVETFDPANGNRFNTYAYQWIRQSIGIGLETRQSVRVPRHAVKAARRWRRKERELTNALGRPPSHEETATALGLSRTKRETVRSALGADRRMIGFGDPDANGTELEPADIPDHRSPADSGSNGEDSSLELRLRRLTDRERYIIGLRFGLSGADPLTLAEIGDRLGYTRERIRQLEKQALTKMAG